ncbi:MAG: serine hydrolase domain-containing protein [Rhizobacter sp.]
MERWLRAALDYVPQWVEFQMRMTEQPGCSFAIAHKGKVVAEHAFGHADVPRGMALTPRHRFRVASHSKTFTAAGLMLLRERGRVTLDDAVGRHVGGLHARVAKVTLAQLLSHSAGLVRDGRDAGQWSDRRPFLDEAELRADLAAGPVIEPNSRFKYSNHGYGLLGLVIEAVTGEPYTDWIAREVVAASGLEETVPDGPPPARLPLARGHTPKWLTGARLVIPGDNPTRALASATGFISTAADLARFFGSLLPTARASVLSPASRREMTRRQWRDPHSSLERWYGLGTISGTVAEWDWVGHSGGFQGTITRTVALPALDLAVSFLTNAADGLSHVWLEGALHILRAHARHGAPSRGALPWAGRWWSLWGPVDIVPVNGKLLACNPALANPVMDASEIAVGGRAAGGESRGVIALANGFASHGESARLERDARGRAKALWLGGTRLLPEAVAAKEVGRRYG